jgi:hypothetical protein
MVQSRIGGLPSFRIALLLCFSSSSFTYFLGGNNTLTRWCGGRGENISFRGPCTLIHSVCSSLGIAVLPSPSNACRCSGLRKLLLCCPVYIPTLARLTVYTHVTVSQFVRSLAHSTSNTSSLSPTGRHAWKHVR